jgi:hypothetical protein
MFAPWPGRARNQTAYAEARRLRADEGMPFKRIAARLGISAATAHLWTKDIPIASRHQERNLRGPGGPQDPKRIPARVASISRKWRHRRQAYQEEGRAWARRGDALHAAGCMLYWAEGRKSRNQLRICNSEVAMIAFFRRFVTECFDVEPSRFALSLHVYTGNGLSVRKIEDHWLRRLDLPHSCFRKNYINPLPTSSSGRKSNKLPYGVCTLSVLRATDILQHIYGAIQEYAEFEEPEWLG